MQKDLQYLRRDLDKVLDRRSADILKPHAKLSGTDRSDDVKEAAVRALERRIVIDPLAIEAVSQPLLQKYTNVNWDAAVALLNLRSFVNSTLEQAKRNVSRVVGPSDHGKRFGNNP